MGRTSRSRRPCARGEVLCAEPGRSHPCPDLSGPAREGNSRTPSMYADEKSDEAVVLRKRPNKGRQLPAEVVEGRASPEGNSRRPTGGRGSDTEPRCHVGPIGGCAPERLQFQNHVPPTFDLREARCVSSARRGLCGGRGVILCPTATLPTEISGRPTLRTVAITIR